MSDDEPRRAGPQPPDPTPGPDDPTEPLPRSSGEAPDGGGEAPDGAVTQTNAVATRAIAAAIAALFVFGSCGIAYGVFRASRGGETVTVTTSPAPPSPSPTPSASPSPSVVEGVDLLIVELTESSVTVANVGTSAAGRFVVSLGGKAFIVEGGLAPGGTRSFGFACRTGPLTAVADSTERVEETDETNNALTAGPFHCAGPSPTASISPTPTSSPSPGVSPTTAPELPDLVVTQVSSDRAVVKNAGQAPAGSFVVDVSGVGTFLVSGLSPGASRTLAFPCTEGTIEVTVDATSKVTESNEGNNVRRGGPFVCLPDLVVTSIGIDSVTIANQGSAGAGPSTLGVNGQFFEVPAIAAGRRATVHTGCFGGTVVATADLLDHVAESNENNNTRTSDVGACP